MTIDELKKEALDKIDKIENKEDLESFRLKYFSRKNGELTKMLKSIKDLSEEERKKVGFLTNEFKKELEILIERKNNSLKNSVSKKIDLTKPHKKVEHGELHPLTKIERRIRQIFLSIGFTAVSGPEVETEFNNFDALNIPENHPAREMWDTFWLKKDKSKKNLLLRTHTSPMQVRYMQNNKPPFQIIVPGRVFRNEATDASHEMNFYQIEGLMVGEDISMANFMHVMKQFFEKLFANKDLQIRYRPSYFPFVEPGLEIDIKLKGGDWMEIAGAGMVHPNVFKSVGYDADKVRGFAFGFGLDRLAMIKYNIPDIRFFYSGDLRFIKQPYK